MRGRSSGASAYEGLVKQRPLTPSRASNASGNETETLRIKTSASARKRSDGASRSSTPAGRDENGDTSHSSALQTTYSTETRRPRSRTRSSSARERSKVVTKVAATDDAEHQAQSYYNAVSRRLSCSSERKDGAGSEGEHTSRKSSFVPVFAVSSSSELVNERAGTSAGSADTTVEKDNRLYGGRTSWGRSIKKEPATEESVSRLSKRASRLGLPGLEKDLLPSLNDTVERMTHGISRVDSKSDHSSMERASSRENRRQGWNAAQQEGRTSRPAMDHTGRDRFSPAFRGTSPVTPQHNLLTPDMHELPRKGSGTSADRSPRLTPSSGIPKPKSILKSPLRPSANSERVSFEDDRAHTIQNPPKTTSKSRPRPNPSSPSNAHGTPVAFYRQYKAQPVNAVSKLPRDSLQVNTSTPVHGRNSPRVPLPSPKWNSSPTPALRDGSYFPRQPVQSFHIHPELSQETSDAASIKSASTTEGALSEDTTSADERYLAAEQVINAAGRLSPLAMNAYRGHGDAGYFTSSTPKRAAGHDTPIQDPDDDSEGSDYDTEASLEKGSGDSHVRRRQELVDLVSGMTFEEQATRSRGSTPGFLSLRRHRLGMNARTPEKTSHGMDSDEASGDESTPCVGIAIGGSTPTTCSTDVSMRSLHPTRTHTSSNPRRPLRQRGPDDMSMKSQRLGGVEDRPSPEENRDSVLLLNADLQREAFGIPPSSSSLGGSCSGFSSAESSLSLQNAALDSEPEDDIRRGLGLSFGAEKLFQGLSIGGSVNSTTNSKRYQEFEERVERHSRRHSKALSQGGHFTDSSRNSVNAPYQESQSKRRSQQPGRRQHRDLLSANGDDEKQHPLRRDELLGQYGEIEIRRQEVIQELCGSERSFVATLGNVLEVYVHPLLDENRRWMTGVPPLAANLLDWLDDIYQLHAQICSALDYAQSSQVPIVTSIAAPLRHFVARLEVYQPYICRLDEVVELIEDAMGDPKSEFGEFLRLQNPGALPSDSELTSSLWLPLTRLGNYLDLFNTLWTLTPRHHPDYLPTYSLLTSVTLVVRVLREVKLREDEYSFVKGLVSRIRGLNCLDGLVKRERRLRAHGPLYMLPEDAIDGTVVPSGRNMKSGQQSPSSASRTGSRLQGKTSAPNPRRRAASLDSCLSAASSMSSIVSSASSTGLNNNEGKALSLRSARQETSAHSRIYAFVFDDLALITHHSLGSDAGGEDAWELASDIGICRVLSISQSEDGHRAFCLHIYPIDQCGIGTGVDANAPSVYVTMQVPSVRRTRSDASSADTHPEAETFDLWWRAFQRCCVSSIRSLSEPSHPGSYLSDGSSIEGNATSRQTIMSLVASGLPIPKSPSLQLAEPQTTRTLAEREERGWWSLRFHEVLCDIQSQDALLLEFEHHPRSQAGG